MLLVLPVGPLWAKTASEIFEAASPSVVTVHVQDAAGSPKGLGSGVVIGQGVVVTNCHVIEDGVRYSVKHAGREYPAAARHTDWNRDVCSLSVPDLAARPVPLGSTRQLKVGQKVYAIGAPQGLELTLSEGIISALRDVTGGRYLQITAPISPGSSGGGLFDEEGRLIGLPTFYLSEGQQLNFAVPVEWVQALPQRQSAQDASSRPSQSSSQWLARAIALEQKQDWPALLQHAQAWTRNQPKEAVAWFALGIAYGRFGETAKAIEAFQQALRIDPQYAAAWAGLGFSYHRSGEIVKAIEAYQQALRIDPQDAKTWGGLGLAYRHSGQTAKAIEAFQQPLRIDPQYAMAWYFLGATYRIEGRRGELIGVYEALKLIDRKMAEEFFNKIVLP
ncbi:trypsin-like peptidase domain-containing protein [Pelomicrobium methylotrophicum]|uniref:trypsin-like peptidase domain-containing protein n=1 Tax=Pelomicrobium methylotrophicum TaxID=2602750 RepID=UPI001969B942|nr:tetratricopeptide repeat-containing serine protease family protein [Pelomicrobium methylotrophicum]